MSLEGNSVFARQQELLDKLEANHLELMGSIVNAEGANFDEPILKGLVSEENPLYGPLSGITIRTALLVVFATSAGGALATAIKPILSLLGLAGISNQDIIDAIEDIDVSSKPIRGY